MKIGIVCAPGIGDTLILHIVSHHLALAGYEVTTFTPHRFGKWLEGYRFSFDGFEEMDALFLQHDNSARARAIHALEIPVYTFYGSHKNDKHRPLQKGFDYVCNPNQTMVENVVAAINTLFHIPANRENGLKPPPGLVHRRYKKRAAIHTGSGHPAKNWALEKFEKCAAWMQKEGLEPLFLPQFPSLEALLSFIYESGYFMGNDSGPGHIASYFNIPHLIIGPEEKQMRLWRPGWGKGEVVLPPQWIPNWKGFRLRKNHWKKFITTGMAINCFKNNVLSN